MASIAKEKNGHRRILFIGSDRKRKTIRLGKVSHRAAETVKFKVEKLIEAKLTGHAIDAETSRWVADLEPVLADKLARVGLIPKREEPAQTELRPFLESYIEGRNDLKPASKTAMGLVVNDLTGFFGDSREVASITPGEADDFKQYLIGRNLAQTTIHKRLKYVRSLFRAMQRRNLITSNPFADVKATAPKTSDRLRFVGRDKIDKVLDACPDHHWRTIVALARYGGLRCPSEVLSLRWQDVNWETDRITVQSPKTEHHDGKATRVIPIFAELRPYLSEAFELAEDGAEYVVDHRFRQSASGPKGWSNTNLRTTFQKIICRAGLETWPRLFHNLRASRETELVETFPVQVVTDWLGNTPTVAMQHYLMTTDDHFARAAHNPAQSVHASSRDDTHEYSPANEKTLEKRGFANASDLVQIGVVGPEGLEPPTNKL